jgi:hypothetical protein
MAIYFTMHKDPAPALAVIFDADGFERAKRYKQGLVSDGKYTEHQISISGTDSVGNTVSA